MLPEQALVSLVFFIRALHMHFFVPTPEFELVPPFFCEFLLILLISTWQSSLRENSELHFLPVVCFIFIVCIIVDLHLVCDDLMFVPFTRL